MEDMMKQRLLRSFMRAAVASILLICAVSGIAQELKPIQLPPPQKTGGMPLMEALNLRQTIRSMSDKQLPPQVLSNLLWAAFGVNRPEGQGPRGKVGRTAPSAMNMQEIDMYVAMPEGVYLYEAVLNKLTPVVAKDVRSIAARRPEMAKAPVILVFVADTDKRPAPRPQGQPPGVPPSGTQAPKPPAEMKPASEQPSGTQPTPPKQPSMQGMPPGTLPQGPPSGAPPPGAFPSFGEVDGGFIGQNVYLFCASEGLATCFHGTDKEGLAKAMNLREAQKVLYAQTVGYPAEKK
jgi:nitroreductase